MNIDTSFATSALNALQGPRPFPTSGQDQDGDEGNGRVHHGSGHGGGQMRQAMLQAFQSLGLSMPGQTGSAGNGQGRAHDGDADDQGGNTSNGHVKHDMRQFMHALFQAVRSEKSSTSDADGANSNTPQGGFASGLSSLISQVSNGSAPADLQSAFSTLVADMQPVGAASGTTTAGTTNNTPTVSLQALLTKLQQNLGYGSSAGTTTTGNILDTQA